MQSVLVQHGGSSISCTKMMADFHGRGGGLGEGLHGHNSDNKLNENYAAFKLFVKKSMDCACNGQALCTKHRQALPSKIVQRRGCLKKFNRFKYIS